MNLRLGVMATVFLGGLLALEAAGPPGPPSPDWPGWRGPERNAISRETGLLDRWPARGPHRLWTAEGLGNGHGTPSVAQGRIFGLGDRGDDEVVWALDAETGKELWHYRIASATRTVKLDPNIPQRGRGQTNRLDPRSTPTIAAGRVYALGIMGDLVCLDVATGKLLWRCHLVNDLKGVLHYHGFVESPLVEGDLVIVSPGGPTATLTALDRRTGKVVWNCRILGDRQHYSSPIVGEVGGRRILIQFLEKGLVGVDARTGKSLWRVERPRGATYSIATPLFHDGFVFASESLGGGILAQLTAKGDEITATPVYTTTRMRNQHGGMVLVDGKLYGCNGELLTCLDFRTGKLAWTDRSVGKASLIYANGHLYVRGERGTIALVEANPDKYVEKGRFTTSRQSSNTWAHPVIAGGRLFLRDQGTLHCYDLRPTK